MLTNGKTTILVAEDDPDVRNFIEIAIRCQGYAVECAEDGEEALSILEASSGGIGLVLLDAIMPRKDGLETLRDIRNVQPDLPVIMFSGMHSPLRVVEAMRNGATNFLPKPLSHEDLGSAIRKALNMSMGSAAQVLRSAPDDSSGASFLPWSSRGTHLSDFIAQVSLSDEPVLLEGETGAGKEVLARQIHAGSPRANKPFLKLNCAALPSELVESELFGYERGAFTGAFKNKPGKFELANGGTILLDEIGDMDFKLQAKLLHVLQDHEFERLGGKDVMHVDVRVLAATHCDLRTAIRENRFREDLYYRLNVIRIRVPSLRQRKEEIVSLAHFLLRKHARPGTTPPLIPPALQSVLVNYYWPGNVRELENVMRRYLIFRDPDMIAMEIGQGSGSEGSSPHYLFINNTPAGSPHLSEARPKADGPVIVPSVRPPAPPLAKTPVSVPDIAPIYSISPTDALPEPEPDEPDEPAEPPAIASVLERVNDAKRKAEAEAIVAALNTTRWNRKQAARLLRIDYKALLYKMRKLGIEDHEAAVPVPGVLVSAGKARGQSA